MVQEAKMIPRILRDVSDGVLVLDKQGTILFLNPRGEEMLEFGMDAVGKKYAAVMLGKKQKGNDSFHQFLLDSLRDSEYRHKGEITYTKSNGETIYLQMTTSFLFDESGKEYEGVVVQFADVTEKVLLRKKQEESSVVFISVIVYACGWVLLYAIWDFVGRPISDQLLTQLVMLFGFVVFLIVLRKTSFTLKDLGLQFKNIKSAVIVDSIIAVVGVLLLIVVKFIIMKIAPGFFGEDQPFFNFNFGWGEYFYPVTVVLQEFLTRSVMHENMRRVITSKYSEWLAIIVSSLLFAVLHIHKGIFFMVGAMILLGALGMLYRKQRTIWGLCIPHYILGLSLTIFGLM